MLKHFLKKFLNITIYELLCFFLITLFLFVLLLMYSDVILYSTKDNKTSTQYPVILWWTMEFPGTSDVRDCSNNIKCYVYSNRSKRDLYKIDAYLFYASAIDFNKLPLPRKPKDIIWGLFHEESPRNVEEFMHEKALNLFNFSSTFSRYSDTPFPLQHLLSFEDITSTKYFVVTSLKTKETEKIAPIMYLQSDCETSTERDSYVKELMKYIKVDSFGACLRNKDMPVQFTKDYLNNLDDDEFLHFIAKYKFVIAIENGVCNDYVTEKFWRAIKVGTVPIYFGSPSIRDWFPNKKTAILLQDYSTPKLLVEHIEELLKNDNLYEEYLEHKTKQLISNEKLIEEYSKRPYQINGLKTVENFECLICKKLHEKANKSGVNIVKKDHYDCPKPISALTLQVNPENSWVYSWESAEANVETIYKNVMKNNN